MDNFIAPMFYGIGVGTIATSLTLQTMNPSGVAILGGIWCVIGIGLSLFSGGANNG